MLQTIETALFIVVLYAWLCLVGSMLLGAIAPKAAPEPKAQAQQVQQVQQADKFDPDVASLIFAEIMQAREESRHRSGNTQEFQAKIQLLK